MKIRKFGNAFEAYRNNRGLFFQLSIIAVLAVMFVFSGQASAQNLCTPTLAVSEGDLAPGGLATFTVTSGLGSVTVDHIDFGTGLQSLTVVGTPMNAVVTIPAFTPGTFAPTVVTFTVINPSLPVIFNLRAASQFHAVNIRATCEPPPGPQGCTLTQGYWKNHAEDWPVNNLTLGTVNYTKAQAISILRTPVRGNGLISLAYQLIAAKLNVANGASVPMSVATAIAAADALIGGQVIPPVGSASASTSSTSALSSVLDSYNNGNASGGPPHCD